MDESYIDHIRTIIEQVEQIAYQEGIKEGKNRLLMISNVIPKTVTKQWILDEAKRQAELLRKMMEE